MSTVVQNLKKVNKRKDIHVGTAELATTYAYYKFRAYYKLIKTTPVS